jgi:hypothetical protein
MSILNCKRGGSDSAPSSITILAQSKNRSVDEFERREIPLARLARMGEISQNRGWERQIEQQKSNTFVVAKKIHAL